MKRLSFLFACVLLMFACSEAEPPTNTPVADPILTITSGTDIWVEREGGSGEITYTIENPQSGMLLTAKSSVDWITDVSVGQSVTYNVGENDTVENRRGTIVLNYGDESRIVTIKQHSISDVIYEATTTAGSLYYGGEGVYCYTVVLSTAGLSADGYLQPNSEYYYFDLYSDIPANGETAIIPEGTYVQTQNSMFVSGDIDPAYSNLTITSDSDYDEIPFSSAKVVVTKSGIEAIVDFYDDERHRIVYRGSLEIPCYDPGQGGGSPVENLSTLTSDHLFDIEDGVFVGAYVGDLLGSGCNTCQVYLFEYLDYETGEERGDQFQIDLQLALGATDICGTYTEGTSVGHFIPGWAEDIGDQYVVSQNSWYMTAGYVDFAPLVEGSVKVEKGESDLYIFTIDTVDDKGNAIKGVFKGFGEFIEW